MKKTEYADHIWHGYIKVIIFKEHQNVENIFYYDEKIQSFWIHWIRLTTKITLHADCHLKDVASKKIF